MKYCMLRTCAPIQFKIGNANVNETESEKLLGIHLSHDLKWSHHLSKLESKLITRLYTLRKLEQVIPKSLLKMWQMVLYVLKSCTAPYNLVYRASNSSTKVYTSYIM